MFKTLQMNVAKVQSDIPRVMDGINVSPSEAMTKQMKDIAEATGLSYLTIGMEDEIKGVASAYVMPPECQQRYAFDFKWANIKLSSSTVDDEKQKEKLLEVASYPHIVRWLNNRGFVVVDVSEGEGLINKCLFDCAIYTPRKYCTMDGVFRKEAEVIAKHRLRGRSDLVF